jgi:hypothetical protein
MMASGEEKWFLQLDYVNMGKPTTIYFDIDDAKVFNEKVGQSLKEQKGKGFNPKNTMLNPARWQIMLDNGLNSFAEIYFTRKMLIPSTIK